jgi:hypothetical protein
MSSPSAPSRETPPLPLDTQLPLDAMLLLALLDLKTERLLAEVEPLIEAIANQQATEAALLDRLDRGSI